MIVAIAGKGWIAVRAAQLLAAMITVHRVDASIAVVRNSDDTGRDSWLPSLANLARQRGWKIHETPGGAGLGAGDIFLSLQYDRIVDCAALGGAAAYNLHFANLPHYRGSLTSSLPIRHGATEAGVTLHVLVQEVDAGPVIASRTFELPPFWTAYDLYRAYHEYGFDLLKDYLPALLGGDIRATPQDDTLATTFTRKAMDFSDVELDDFSRDAEQVRDWCRSLIFPPAQYPTYRGRRIGSCAVVSWAGSSAGSVPGTVVYSDADQAVITCRKGGVWLELLAL